MAVVSMRALLETGVHFGHRTNKWHPKMKPYIFTERNGIYIIDLQQTVVQLQEAYNLVRDTVANDGTILFVGTKRQAQETIEREANRCGMPFVNIRWLGGTLTNWRTIRERIDTLKDMERRRDQGEWELLTKKERLMLDRKLNKLQVRLGGIREMKKVPDLMFGVDTNRELTAIKEANILHIPVIAIVDTNCNPDLIDHLIVGNDDAIRAIKLITGVMADAALEGQNIRLSRMDESEIEAAAVPAYDAIAAEGDDVDDTDYLGEATLAKLRDADLFAPEETEAESVAENESGPETTGPEGSVEAATEAESGDKTEVE